MRHLRLRFRAVPRGHTMVTRTGDTKTDGLLIRSVWIRVPPGPQRFARTVNHCPDLWECRRRRPRPAGYRRGHVRTRSRSSADTDVSFFATMETSGSTQTGPTWSWTDLKKPFPALAALAAFVVSAAASQIVACNVHEIGHAAVATPLGWEVDRIRVCAPGGGGVDYAHVGNWAGNLQGYAGGVIAALFLYGVYRGLIARQLRPHRTPWWWAVGLGVVVWIGPQLVLAGMEGSRGPNEDYTELFQTHGAIFYPLLLLSVVVGVLSYTLRWQRQPGRPTS